ncbi:MAG: Hsp20/alpha crystallin family protein [bacterium]
MWPFKKELNPQLQQFQQQQPPMMPMPSTPFPVMPQQQEENWFDEQPAFEGQLAVDVHQTDSDIVIKAPVAGVLPEDIDITITEDVITIKGTRKEDPDVPKEAYYTQECYYGSFSRSIILPVPVLSEQADATFKNGVLQVIIPKAEKARTKTLKIKTSS